MPDAVLKQAFGVFLLLVGTKQLTEDVTRALGKRTKELSHAKLHD